MSLSPDESRFTACVVGESRPDEQAAFDAALVHDAGLRGEALGIRRTALRLAAALRQESPVSLTLSQRHAVLQQGIPARRNPSRRQAWLGPSLATAGIAAALALGLYALPGIRVPSRGTEQGIPSVAIQQATTSKAVSMPILPPAAVGSGAPAAPGIPRAAPPESPAPPHPSEAMAAAPPVIKVVPAPPANKDGPLEDFAQPGQPRSGHAGPGGSLASPAPFKP